MSRWKMVALIAAIAIVVAGLFVWWRHQELHPSSDDAYLQADVLTIAPLIGGRVIEVAVVENQRVEQGDRLFRIDDAQLRLVRDAADAQLEVARRAAASVGDSVGAASAQLSGAQAALLQANTELSRNQTLRKAVLVAQAVVDQALAQRNEAAAQEAAARANLAAAKSQAGSPGIRNASVRAAIAALDQAALNLSYAEVVAPAAGWIANLTLRPGQVVVPNQPLFSLVEADHWWVDANFKETDLQHVRPRQPATVEVDMYPGHTLHGSVESIGAGSGAVFSLLPPENATGNWVKVTQRFPVRIRLDDTANDPVRQLRVGASVVVTVDTTAAGVE
ncbi:MAG: HlyD family secretion protein [Pseudomonadales bacterium]|nr:HlyD family secretion protein [Pseudomonadales bacterium]